MYNVREYFYMHVYIIIIVIYFANFLTQYLETTSCRVSDWKNIQLHVVGQMI